MAADVRVIGFVWLPKKDRLPLFWILNLVVPDEEAVNISPLFV